MENLIANSGQLTGATRKRVEDNKAQIEFSKFLATIKTDVPLPEDITPQAMTRSEPDYQTLAEIYRKLEFRTFIKRMESAGQLAAPHPAEPAADGFVGSLFDEPAEQSASNLTTTPHNYTCITDNKTLQTAVDEALTNISPIGITVYAPGESAMSAPWLGIAVSPAEGKAFYAVVPAENTDKATRKEFFGLISRLAASPNHHNQPRCEAGYDSAALAWHTPDRQLLRHLAGTLPDRSGNNPPHCRTGIQIP